MSNSSAAYGRLILLAFVFRDVYSSVDAEAQPFN
jgi:hypothetical protein